MVALRANPTIKVALDPDGWHEKGTAPYRSTEQKNTNAAVDRLLTTQRQSTTDAAASCVIDSQDPSVEMSAMTSRGALPVASTDAITSPPTASEALLDIIV